MRAMLILAPTRAVYLKLLFQHDTFSFKNPRDTPTSNCELMVFFIICSLHWFDHDILIAFCNRGYRLLMSVTGTIGDSILCQQHQALVLFQGSPSVASMQVIKYMHRLSLIRPCAFFFLFFLSCTPVLLQQSAQRDICHHQPCSDSWHPALQISRTGNYETFIPYLDNIA